MDIVDPATRSRMMSSIRSRDTRPEMALRRALHRRGLRFRVHARELPGRPDLLLPRWRVVVLVHGCFWHRHGGCRYATSPATRPEFWQDKFRRNVERDARNEAQLAAAGWRIARIWECALSPARLGQTSHSLADWIVDPAAGALHESALVAPLTGEGSGG